MKAGKVRARRVQARRVAGWSRLRVGGYKLLTWWRRCCACSTAYEVVVQDGQDVAAAASFDITVSLTLCALPGAACAAGAVCGCEQ